MNKKTKPETLCLGFIMLSIIICFMALITCDVFGNTENFVPVSTTLNVSTSDSDVTADPDGYLNGKWNLWEFVGDLFSGMIE